MLNLLFATKNSLVSVTSHNVQNDNIELQKPELLFANKIHSTKMNQMMVDPRNDILVQLERPGHQLYPGQKM